MNNTGIFLLDKEKGESSARALSHLKRKLSLKKIGHAGTLDPMATGLLVCLAGRATKLSSFALQGNKIYSGEIRLGIQTDSDDLTGQVIKESDYRPSSEELLSCISKKFIGSISQTPPQISAVHVNGVRAYQLARKGERVNVPERTITIYTFDVWRIDNDNIGYKIKCSHGTYIRSIARDLGLYLGCGASLSAIRREYSYPFFVERAKKVEETRESDMLDWFSLFPDTPRIFVNSRQTYKLSRGDKAELSVVESEHRKDFEGASIALYCLDESKIPIGIIKVDNLPWRFAFTTGEFCNRNIVESVR